MSAAAVKSGAGEGPKRRRGRPRQFNRSDVLDRMTNVLLASGLEGATMAQLSAVSRVNRPSLRLAFGERDSLICAVIERYRSRIGSALCHLSKEPLQEALQSMLRHFISIYSREPPAPSGCLLLAVMPSVPDSHPAVSAAIEVARLEIRDALARRMLTAQRGLSAKAALVPTQLCVSLISWLAVEARAGASRASLENAADAFAAFIAGSSGSSTNQIERQRGSV